MPLQKKVADSVSFDPSTRQALLHAADLIQKAASTLNSSTDVCDCCHRTKYVNFNESQMSVELSAIVRKLKNFAK